jgi:crotonobetainyl-CoA:carnitine CoA-transferase CaiB-like acyl-CoA transferase
MNSRDGIGDDGDNDGETKPPCFTIGAGDLLKGVTVVEFSQFISAPYVGQMLAQWGAEVWKIESPAGDPFRTWDGDLYGPPFQAYNQGKRSVVLDLKTPLGNRAAMDLVTGSDVLIENFRPGVLGRLGLGFPAIHAAAPHVVYCSISGFGEHGTRASEPGFDTLAQARTGLMSLLMDPENPKLRGPAFADGITGLTAVGAIAGALVKRYRTGRGSEVRTSLYESGVAFLGELVSNQTMVENRARDAQAFLFRTRDDQWLVVHLSGVPRFWSNLLAALDDDLLAADPRFADLALRRQNYEELADELGRRLLTGDRADWLSRLASADVPAAAVETIPSALANALTAELGMVQQPIEGMANTVPIVRNPVRVDGNRVVTPPAPAFGRDTVAALRLCGWDDELISTAVRDKAARIG